MSLGHILKNVWYPKFLPKNITKFTVFGWKVQTINAGDAGKQLQLSRISDGKRCDASFKELEAKMATRAQFIFGVRRLGFVLDSCDDGKLVFKLHRS